MITANEARELTVQDVRAVIRNIEPKIKLAALGGNNTVKVNIISFYDNERKVKAVKKYWKTTDIWWRKIFILITERNGRI